jgi:hypothetical protein
MTSLSCLSLNKNFFGVSYTPQPEVIGTIHMPGLDDPSNKNLACNKKESAN